MTTASFGRLGFSGSSFDVCRAAPGDIVVAGGGERTGLGTGWTKVEGKWDGKWDLSGESAMPICSGGTKGAGTVIVWVSKFEFEFEAE